MREKERKRESAHNNVRRLPEQKRNTSTVPSTDNEYYYSKLEDTGIGSKVALLKIRLNRVARIVAAKLMRSYE